MGEERPVRPSTCAQSTSASGTLGPSTRRDNLILALPSTVPWRPGVAAGSGETGNSRAPSASPRAEPRKPDPATPGPARVPRRGPRWKPSRPRRRPCRRAMRALRSSTTPRREPPLAAPRGKGATRATHRAAPTPCRARARTPGRAAVYRGEVRCTLRLRRLPRIGPRSSRRSLVWKLFLHPARRPHRPTPRRRPRPASHAL